MHRIDLILSLLKVYEEKTGKEYPNITFYSDGSGGVQGSREKSDEVIFYFHSVDILVEWLGKETGVNVVPKKLDSPIVTLKEEVDTLKEEIDRLRSEVSDLKSGEWSTENSIDDIKKQLKCLRVDVNKVMDNDSVELEEIELEEKIDDLRKYIDVTNEDIKSIRTNLNGMSQVMLNLVPYKAPMDDAIKDIKNLRLDVKNLESKIETQNDKVSFVLTEITRISKENSYILKELNKIKTARIVYKEV